jgi:predicted MFS family arabinose efflux permease
MATTESESVSAVGAPVGLSRATLWLLAIACGVSVANVYFPQAISPLIAAGLHTGRATATLVATTTQLGYAAGLFLLVPLGDRMPHRRLVTVLLLATAAGLAVAGSAPGPGLLLAASVCVGVTTVVPQILLPMAAGLVAERDRGAVTGRLLSGLLAGILLARTFSGALGGWLGWRAPYLIAAGLALVLAAALARAMPVTVAPARQSYRSLLAAPLRLLRTEPALRRSVTYQVLLFAAFNAAWTALALLLTGARYHLGTGAVGLLALVGAGSVLASPAAGRRVDRVGPSPVNLICFALALAAAGILATGTLGGTGGLVGLAAGMLLLDVAVQCGQVANQARIFAAPGPDRARRNTAYMTCAFLGGSAGSWLGAHAYTTFGWAGLPVLIALAAITAAASFTAFAAFTPGRSR